MSNDLEKTHLKLTELAHRWGVSTVYLRREIWAGRLRATRFGRVVRVAVDEAERFAVEHLADVPHQRGACTAPTKQKSRRGP